MKFDTDEAVAGSLIALIIGIGIAILINAALADKPITKPDLLPAYRDTILVYSVYKETDI